MNESENWAVFSQNEDGGEGARFTRWMSEKRAKEDAERHNRFWKNTPDVLRVYARERRDDD